MRERFADTESGTGHTASGAVVRDPSAARASRTLLG
jgi:hypothetical protein